MVRIASGASPRPSMTLRQQYEANDVGPLEACVFFFFFRSPGSAESADSADVAFGQVRMARERCAGFRSSSTTEDVVVSRHGRKVEGRNKSKR